MIGIDVTVERGGWASLDNLDDLARRAAEAAFAVVPEAPERAEISLLLTDDAGMRALNRTWRGLDKPTNVLSFPASALPSPDGVSQLGDIVLAFDTAAREADDENKLLTDHVLHLLVHAVLHLLGHDHEAEEQAAVMEALEVEALARLGVANPYRDMAA
jgi:probable rRNA maturation factor